MTMPIRLLLLSIVLPVLLLSLACSGSSAPASPVHKSNLGQEITVIGTAIDHKNGAAVHGDGFVLWISDLSSWPAGFYLGGDKGKKVRVKGLLGEDTQLPVFIPRPGKPIVQGIPVPQGADLEAMGHRFLLKNPSWELLPE